MKTQRVRILDAVKHTSLTYGMLTLCLTGSVYLPDGLSMTSA
jgi:hypothetical protein